MAADATRFAEITRRFEAAHNATAGGIFADKSTLWKDVLTTRANFPTFAQFQRILAHDTPFATGLGIGDPLDLPAYTKRYQDWVSRYASEVAAADLTHWPEADVGSPTILEHEGYRASMFYIKNYAQAQIIEQAIKRHHPRGTGLRMLEVGAGYGGAAEILLRKGIGARFTDIDLPENLFFATQYLQATHPPLSAAIINRAAPNDGKGADLRFAFPNELPLFDGEEFDLAYNVASFGEMPAETAQAYIAWISDHLAPGGIFVSHNTHAVRGMKEVVQKQSAYGFERFKVLDILPQPSPANLRNQTHVVAILGRRTPNTRPLDKAVFDAVAAAIGTGLAQELSSAIASLRSDSKTADRLSPLLRDILAARTLADKYTAAGARTGETKSDLALEYLQGAIAFPAAIPTACSHFAKYLVGAQSTLGICFAAAVLRQTPGIPRDDAAIAAALARVPPHLARLVDTLPLAALRERYVLNLGLT